MRIAIATAGAILLTGRLLACAPAAESAYTAALLRCVDTAKTLAESRECRRHVDGDYGITQTIHDGGPR